MKTNLLIIIALIFISIGINAQSNPESIKEFKHGIGLAAGATSGYGLSYQYFPNTFGVQLVLGGIKYQSDYTLSLGAIFKFELIENTRANLFLYQSNSILYDKYSYDGYDFDTGQELGMVVEQSTNINNGVGVGTDISIGNRLSLNVMGGVGSYNLLEVITVTGEVAFFYRL